MTVKDELPPGGRERTGRLKLALTCLAFFAAAFLVRFNRLDAISPFTVDEAMHAASAVNYAERGYFGPDNWYHPPLKHILLYGSIKLFGDNKYGWRMRNVLFGAGTIVLMYLLGLEVFSSTPAAVVSAGLLLFDPLHVIFSRTTFEDIPSVLFLVLALLFTARALRNGRDRDWILTGISFGIATALRLYCAIPLLMVLPFAAFRSFERDGIWGAGATMAYLAVLPFMIYLSAYLPWFLRGYSLTEWLPMQLDALREMRTVGGFQPSLMALQGPWRWFLQEVAAGFDLGQNDGWGRYIAVMNNLPLWIFILPSVLYLNMTGLRERNRSYHILGLSFWALYLPFLEAARPIFLYTSLCLLPIGFLAVGFAAARLLKRRAYGFLTAATAWGLFLYPLVAGIPIPLRLYRPILSFIRIFQPS